MVNRNNRNNKKIGRIKIYDSSINRYQNDIFHLLSAFYDHI